jgi:transmembrane sensor
MSQERFTVLMRQFIGDQVTEQDMEELRSLVAAGGYEEEMKKLYDEVYDSPAYEQDLSPDRVQKILYAIYNSEEAGVIREAEAPGKVLPLRRRAGAWWWAAAALLLLTGGYLVLKRTERSADREKTAVRPSLPDHTDKAILTLANGQQILLDNSAKGQLAEQNGVSVVKTDSGQLTYVYGGKGTGGPQGSVQGGSQYNTLATPRGGQYQVVLPDGTKVWLNSASSLKYPTVFDGTSRHVELTGEAYFEVAKNSRSPFIVRAAGLQVAVLGTAFNLMAYADEENIRTTLVNGAVRLIGPKGAQVLKPGEQGSLDEKEQHFMVTRPDLDEVLAWKEGEFKFSGQSIRTIMRQMARWYDVEIEYQGTPPANLFNGNITRTQNASVLLDILETTKTVHFNIEGRKIIVINGPAVESR